jgi:hypothetical protein
MCHLPRGITIHIRSIVIGFIVISTSFIDCWLKICDYFKQRSSTFFITKEQKNYKTAENDKFCKKMIIKDEEKTSES